MLKEDTKISECIEDQINVQSVSTFYQIAKVYNLTSLARLSLSYIERCFPMVVETKNFLELQFNLVANILASSELSVHSELEIFNAVNEWMRHNFDNRGKFAKDLLLKVRLPLLSDHVLKYLVNKSSSFLENNECVEILKAVSYDKESFFRNKATKYYVNRYCNQKKFNILICGGRNVEHHTVNDVNQIDGSDFNNVKVFPSMAKERYDSEAVCLKGEVYIFGGFDNVDLITSIEKYSPSANTWNEIAYMFDNRQAFCACTFMENIYVIGGCYYADEEWTVTKSCLQFDTKDNNWKEVAAMNEAKDSVACAVFEGKIVVSGGCDNNNDKLNTVESYDVIADKWSSMPNMIGSKSLHSLVVVRNNLFVIGFGDDTCEVLEKNNKKFVALKSSLVEFVDLNKTISIGNKILVYRNNTATILSYDVDKNEWSEESCKVTKHLEYYSRVKLPRY